MKENESVMKRRVREYERGEESVSEGKRCFLKMKCNNQTSAWGFEAVLVIIFLPSFSPFFISSISLSLSHCVIACALGRDSRISRQFLLQLRRKTGRGSKWGMKEGRRIQILKENFFSTMMDDASLKERHMKETFRKNAFLGESKLRSSNFPHHNLSYFSVTKLIFWVRTSFTKKLSSSLRQQVCERKKY